MIKKVVLDKADRLYHFPFDIEDFFPRTPSLRHAGRFSLIDLGHFNWPINEASFAGNDNPVALAGPEDILSLKSLLSAWLEKTFNLSIDPRKEIYIGQGIKRIILDLCLAFVEPGDIVLCPEPGHPIYLRHVITAGGIPVSYPLTEKTEFKPNPKRLSPNLLKSAKIMILNSPNNPLGIMLDETALAELVRTTSKENLFLVNDAAYSSLAEERYSSLLSIHGAERASLEIFSIPLTFGLPYFPLGFAIGSPEIISGLEAIAKTTGNYIPKGWVTCSKRGIDNYPSDSLKKIRKSMIQSRLAAFQMVERLGWKIYGGNHSPFIWLRIPGRRQSIPFAAALLRRRGILTLPGNAFGDSGEGYLRLSLTASPNDYQIAGERFKGRWLTHEKVNPRLK